MNHLVSQRPSPLFAVFARDVANNLERTLATDGNAEKLARIEEVLSQLSLQEDWEALRRLDLELMNLSLRSESWRNRLKPSQEKVVQLKRLGVVS